MKNQERTGNKKRQLLIASAAVLCLVGVMFAVIFKNHSEGEDAAANGSLAEISNAAHEASSETDILSIPLSEVSETASFYPVVVDGTPMEVLAIRASDGSVRTAFNTCQSCYTSGNGRYEAEGTELVCQNCGFHFSADEVGIETGGGCNPWPITDANREITENEIVISNDFLAESKNIFANWRSK